MTFLKYILKRSNIKTMKWGRLFGAIGLTSAAFLISAGIIKLCTWIVSNGHESWLGYILGIVLFWIVVLMFYSLLSCKDEPRPKHVRPNLW